MFGGCIRRDIQAPFKGHDRTDIDDFPATASQHVSGDLLRQIERSMQVNFKKLMPFAQRIILGRMTMRDPRVVHQNVEPTRLFENLVNQPPRSAADPDLP